MSYAIGIDLGGTNIKAAVVTEAGELLAQDHFETGGDEPSAWAGRVKDYVAAVQRQHGKAQWIGVASPGLAARDARGISWMQGRMAGVQGFIWADHLDRPLVPVINDAHAALLGEVWRGAAAGAQNAILLTLGTGVGGAILCDGKLLRGHLGRAGHLGHLSMDFYGSLDIVKTPGSLEDAIGDCTVAKRTGGQWTSTQALVEAHLAGNARAGAIWERSIRALAAGIVSIVNAVDPEVVIIGGGIAAAGAALFQPLQRWLDQFEWRPTGTAVRIAPAQLGDGAGALGAARYAMTF